MTKAERKAAKANGQTTKEYLKERLKNIPLTVVMSLFAAYCIFSAIYFPVIGRWRDGLISVVYLVVVPIFYFAEKSLNMRVPLAYTLFLMTFVLFCHLGACFNFYYYIPCLDDILHAAWGIVFSTIGIIVIKSWLGLPKTNKGVVAYILFGLGFAMILSVVWEIYEYVGDLLIPDMDMQQDTIVDHIHSFIMYPNPANPAPDNLHTWQVENISYTVLYNEAGEEIGRIYGGYLDLGLIDTMLDLIYCFCFVTAFSVILAIDWCNGKFIYRYFIPALVGEFDSPEKKAEPSPASDELTPSEQSAEELAEEEPAEEQPTEEPAEEE